MDSEDQFWLAFWKLFGAVLCVGIVSGAGCEGYQNHLESQLVMAGNDPQKVRCLFHSTNNNDALLCQSIISQKHE